MLDFGKDDTKLEKAEQWWLLLWRGINLVMCIFFLLAAYVQINDEDPYIWIPVYAISSLLCLSVVCKPDVADFPLYQWTCRLHMTACGVYTCYLVIITIIVLEGVVKNPLEHEEGRELAGTFIVTIWLLVTELISRSRSATTASKFSSLLVVTLFLGITPLFLWGLCFIPGLEDKIGHCKDMFVATSSISRKY